jgi:pSer/pThr/pTyr-binding forkhead associated (FHA) protein
VQADASFCGQCGFNLKAAQVAPVPAEAAVAQAVPDPKPDDLPELPVIEPLVPPDPLIANPDLGSIPPTEEAPDEEPVTGGTDPTTSGDDPANAPQPMAIASPAAMSPAPGAYSTQLQTQTARMLHVQSNTILELPTNLTVIHIGKPNDRVPPDIDVSGFQNSEIVSRIHADIRVEPDAFYIEDVGSSNGTYINNAPLPAGNRHRLRSGDRIALGKGDKVTFLFQV